MRTHPMNVAYLVFGLLFLGLAGSWALGESGLVVLDDAEWLLPLMLVAAGVIGLLAVAAKGLSRRNASRYDDEPGAAPYDSYPNDIEGDLR